MRNLAATAFGLALAAAGQATILTYEGFPQDGTGDIRRYGSNVSGPGSSPFGTYEKGRGWTPNVIVEHYTYSLGGWEIADHMKYWQGGYTGGGSVAIPTQDGAKGLIIFRGGGHDFTIHSLELKTYGGVAMTAAPVRIRTLTGHVLWSSGPLAIGEDQVLRVEPEYTVAWSGAGMVYLEYGDSWNIGIDNLHFSEAVPEPATLAAMAVGLAGLRRSKLRRTGCPPSSTV